MITGWTQNEELATKPSGVSTTWHSPLSHGHWDTKSYGLVS